VWERFAAIKSCTKVKRIPIYLMPAKSWQNPSRANFTNQEVVKQVAEGAVPARSIGPNAGGQGLSPCSCALLYVERWHFEALRHCRPENAPKPGGTNRSTAAVEGGFGSISSCEPRLNATWRQ
jgi:hypothetical protein